MSELVPPSLATAQRLLKQNFVGQAEVILVDLLRKNSRDLSCQTLLAVAYLKSGRVLEAEKLLVAIHEQDPSLLEPIGLLAVMRKGQGDLKSAIFLFEQMIQLGGNAADVYNQIGSCYMGLDDPIQAGKAFRQAVELDKRAAHSYYNLGMALRRAGKSHETFLTFKKSTQLNPHFLDNYLQIWEQMRQLQNWVDGIPILETGLIHHPDSTALMACLGFAYARVGKSQVAEEMFNRAFALSTSAGIPFSHWLQEEGRFEESVPILKKVIHANPVQGQAYYILTAAKCFTLDSKPLLEWMIPLTAHPDLIAEEQMYLHYAMAKAYEQAKNYESAMHHFDAANAQAYIRFNSNNVHDEGASEHEARTLASLYSSEFIRSARIHGSQSSVPIFIVGMIRTGTTLLDQILSSHPRVNSAGEQPFWQIHAGRIQSRWLDGGFDREDALNLAAGYLSVLHQAGGTADRIIDKMPINFSNIGLMGVVFPNAKFIHLRRNPLDSCLSIYTTFLGSGTPFAYNKTNIIGYYQSYYRLKEHWRSVMPPEQFIEIDYEDLVTHKETVVRELLEFCDLEWDDACLNHEHNRSQVSTPSLFTARQPVNTASVERWKRYEPWLGQLLELKELKHPPVGRRQPTE